MGNVNVTCVSCGVKKALHRHKAGYIGADAVIRFQMDGWKYLQGTRGLCGDCPRLPLEESPNE